MEPSTPNTDAVAITRVERTSLTALILKLLQRKGMFAAEAEIVAARLIEADLCGLSAEGVGSLPPFLDAMDLGDIDPRARIITLRDAPAAALLDGSTGMGHVAATRAILLAIEKARAVGTGTVVIKNSRLCGDVGVIARLAADAGLIGFVTNSFAESVSHDAGDHALAWGLPTPDGSASLVVRERSLKFGEAPALAIGLLAAGLAGAEPMSRKRKANRVANTVEHFIQAIDPDQFGSRETLLAKWGPTLAARQLSAEGVSNETAASDTAGSDTVPLQAEDAQVLLELAAKIKVELVMSPHAAQSEEFPSGAA